jgi:hypothetical protein
MLPAGFKAIGVGQGALCMTCHNTRNGAVSDATGPSSGYRAPHVAAQADVLMGENAFFVETGVRGDHSFIEDTCATCHMETTPPPAELSYNLSGTNHTFEASLAVCAECHGSFNGGTLMETTEAMLHEMAEAMGAYLIGKMPGQVQVKDYTPHEVEGVSMDVKSEAITLDVANIVSAEPTEPHGRQGYILHLAEAVDADFAPTDEDPYTLSLTEVVVQMADITTDGETAVIAENDALVMAGWNYFLLHGDGSHGVHNPSFTLEVIRASIEALETE